MKIKVLVVDHMGVLVSERKKYQELGRFEDLELTVVVPDRWRFNFKQFRTENDSTQREYKTIILPVAFPGYGHRSFYLSSLKTILLSTKPDIIHLFQEPYSIFAAQFILSRNLFLPSAKIIFITWENLYFANYPFFLSKLYTFIEKYTHKNATCSTPITHSAKEILLKKGFHKKSYVMNWGIDFELFKKQNVNSLQKKLNLENKFVIGFAGRFVHEKGILDLLQAVALLEKESNLEKEIALLLIGDGPLKSEIENLAKSLNLIEKITFIKPVSNIEMNRYLSCLGVLVLPSIEAEHWKEQLGKVLLEAMACNVSVIGSDSGEIPHVIGKTGKIFRSGDCQDLKEKLKEIIFSTNNKELTQKARQRVLSIYSWKKISDDLCNLYCDIIKNENTGISY